MALVKVDKVRTVAEINASRVEDRTDADLLVYVTDAHGVSFGKEEVWSFVENEGESNLRVYWDETTPVSDLKVCFVDDLGVEGWVNEHPMKGSLFSA